jgi:DNA-directed RNA polymerase specialized sigma subunit
MGMIKTQREYEQAQRTLEQWRASGEKLRASIEAAGLSPDHVEVCMAPHLTMQDQMQGELDWYDNARKGTIRPLPTLARIGLSLIALRIASGLTQRQIAERLGVSEAQVSKDEKNEYHGISVDRAQRIVAAMGGSVTLTVSTERPTSADLELAKAQAH